MGSKKTHSLIYHNLKELVEDKFTQLNQRINVIEQKLNDTYKDLKITTGEDDKKSQEAILASQKNEKNQLINQSLE